MEDLKIKLDEKEVAKVDAHIEKASYANHLASQEHLKGIDIGALIGIVGKICAAYAVAKPILDFAIKYLLKWKPNWQKAITNVTGAIDLACSFSPNPAV